MISPANTLQALHILQHSLGLDQYGQGERYRNRFVTGEGSVDWPICMDLVKSRLMQRRNGKTLPFGGDDLFSVTDRGIEFVEEHSPAPPKISRSQQRYRRYLDADSSMSFGEWLRSPWANMGNPA